MQNKWQPIETAPRDGTEILGVTELSKTKAGHQIGGEIEIIRKFDPLSWKEIEIIRKFDPLSWNDKIWIQKNGNLFFPTHWMPLPKPPSNNNRK